jgi:hypothetical protein
MADRDDFTKPVVLVLGQRAAYICSNPDCRRLTAGPHSDPEKPLFTGIACHICAAAEGGPRYDPQQTPTQRKDIRNGIWLCAVCSKKIDTDWKLWPADRLLRMKAEHEAWIASEGMAPSLPEIMIATQSGLQLIPQTPEVTSEMLDVLREQRLTIRNPNRVELHNFKLHMRLPEAVGVYSVREKNAGTQVAMRAEHSPWAVQSVQPGGAVRNAELQAPTPNQTLEIPRLSAGETVALLLYTLSDFHVRMTDDPSLPSRPVEDPDSILPQDHRLWCYMEGTYQYVLRGEYITAVVFVPLRYSFRNRTITSLPCEASCEAWELQPIMRFPGVELKG